MEAGPRRARASPSDQNPTARLDRESAQPSVRLRRENVALNSSGREARIENAVNGQARERRGPGWKLGRVDCLEQKEDPSHFVNQKSNRSVVFERIEGHNSRLAEARVELSWARGAAGGRLWSRCRRGARRGRNPLGRRHVRGWGGSSGPTACAGATVQKCERQPKRGERCNQARGTVPIEPPHRRRSLDRSGAGTPERRFGHISTDDDRQTTFQQQLPARFAPNTAAPSVCSCGRVGQRGRAIAHKLRQ